MTDKEIVRKRVVVAQVHRRLTDSVYEIKQDGSNYPPANTLGEGVTEELAWSDAKVKLENEMHPEEMMNRLIKQLTGQDAVYRTDTV